MAVDSSFVIWNIYQEDRIQIFNNLVQKFSTVDKALDEIHREIHRSERAVRFSDQLGDLV